ncbi:hypothetical protein SPF06_19530 [Sinomonas sp. JGH33]|uniref:Uncharacterized protein n=1 Tax=Sinomonas terricola TaxID=3110330 RepID=A0ABU5TBN0_9MICC|nr:hypothetical protein [Sinomonas sp. JGH33]MEA5456920.1 hypothetical protein [Sinomonas sp. JGH33]
MAQDQTTIREWFDQGAERGMDFMVVARDGFGGDLYPYYVDAQDETTQRAIEQVRDGGDRVLEVYDLKAPLAPQLASGRSWNTEETRPAREHGRADFEEALMFSTTQRSYVFDPAFSAGRVNALTEGALAGEDPAAHELEAVKAIMRRLVAESLSAEIGETYLKEDQETGEISETDEAQISAAVVDGGDQLAVVYPTQSARELYEAGIPSKALIEKAIERAEISTEAPHELHEWRERNAGRLSYGDAIVAAAGEWAYVYQPGFTTERIDALTEGALASESPAPHELEAVQQIMRAHLARSLTEEIHEAHPEAAQVEATVADTDQLMLTYPIIGGRELYEAGIPSQALVEKAIERAEISNEAPDELHAWRERNPLSRPVAADVAAHRAAEYDRHSLGPDGFDGYITAPAEFVDEARARAETLAAQHPERADEIRDEYRKAFADEATEALAAAYPDEPQIAVSTSGVGPQDYLISLGGLSEDRARALYARGVPSADVIAGAVARVDEQAVVSAAALSTGERVRAALERTRAAGAEDEEDWSWQDGIEIGRTRAWGRHGI